MGDSTPNESLSPNDEDKSIEQTITEQINSFEPQPTHNSAESTLLLPNNLDFEEEAEDIIQSDQEIKIADPSGNVETPEMPDSGPEILENPQTENIPTEPQVQQTENVSTPSQEEITTPLPPDPPSQPMLTIVNAQNSENKEKPSFEFTDPLGYSNAVQVHTIFLTNIPNTAPSADIFKWASQFGEVLDFWDRCVYTKGIAFVTYADVRSGVDVIRKGHRTRPFGNREIKVSYAFKKPGMYKRDPTISCSIVRATSNLGRDSHLDVPGVQAFFSTYGDIQEVVKETNGVFLVKFFNVHAAEPIVKEHTINVGNEPCAIEYCQEEDIEDPNKNDRDRDRDRRSDRRSDRRNRDRDQKYAPYEEDDYDRRSFGKDQMSGTNQNMSSNMSPNMNQNQMGNGSPTPGWDRRYDLSGYPPPPPQGGYGYGYSMPPPPPPPSYPPLPPYTAQPPPMPPAPPGPPGGYPPYGYPPQNYSFPPPPGPPMPPPPPPGPQTYYGATQAPYGAPPVYGQGGYGQNPPYQSPPGSAYQGY